MEAVILAGGLGTRLREETEFKPKPMVEIGGRPILWHIMKHLSYYGVNDFVICVGYKGDQIRDYFLNYHARNQDFTVEIGKENQRIYHSSHKERQWKVTIAETGPNTLTGGRIFAIQKYIKGNDFICTYGDGLSDININSLISFHNDNKLVGTVTAVRTNFRFGLLDIDENARVKNFSEKPLTKDWINGGYFVFNRSVFEYVSENTMLEDEPIQQLVLKKQLTAYKHEGFWQAMDTFREVELLNRLWNSGEYKWKVE